MAEQGETDALFRPPLADGAGRGWLIAFSAALVLTLLLVGTLAWTTFSGVGIWGNNIPYVWGFDLANYGWWIGIANGTALFACLLVLWRTPLRLAVNRFAELLALAAAFAAALYPVFHLGKPWLAWWMAPLPADTGLWPQPMSPLTWDFWAIIAYLITIALFAYVGLIPDLALLRDRAKKRRTARIYGLFALGWRGSARQWALQARTHRLLALSVIPFLFAMQTIVALELATTIVPSWHDTALPVRFVIAGFASGTGVTYAFAALLRPVFAEHAGEGEVLDKLGRIVLATALVSAFVVALTTFIDWLGPSERAFEEWTTGRASLLSWISLALSKLVPQLLWFRSLRCNRLAAGLIGLALAVGVWLDHLAVLVIGLAEERLIDPGGLYVPSLAEFALLAGSIGLFGLLALLFARLLPLVSIYETRGAPEELTG